MRHGTVAHCCLMLALLAATLIAASRLQGEPPVVGCGGQPAEPSHFGTAILWEPDPHLAALRARMESKLLFVVQLSGNFAKTSFT